jgi:hypothetical protein
MGTHCFCCSNLRGKYCTSLTLMQLPRIHLTHTFFIGIFLQKICSAVLPKITVPLRKTLDLSHFKFILQCVVLRYTVKKSKFISKKRSQFDLPSPGSLYCPTLSSSFSLSSRRRLVIAQTFVLPEGVGKGVGTNHL